ncbi:MAG: DNA polymerase/3'-5' exonuclease PolX [candidate division KSB1 bacterium]|nr:DNA polymerase/3'-5' exonuclease PolX [candidate division KSB1 bacterium]
MPIHNSDIADSLSKVADLLDIKGANPFRVRAYRQASATISGLSQNITDMLDQGKNLSDLSGIGQDLAGKIQEIAETGRLKQLKELEAELPEALPRMMQMESLGPKRVKTLYDKLNIKSLSDLESAAKSDKIKALKGFGQKTQDKILDELERLQQSGEKQRFRWAIAEDYIKPLQDYLQGIDGVKQLDIAGSYRRRKETVGDVDILVSWKQDADVMDPFVRYEDVERILAHGDTKSSVVLRNGLQVDLRVVPQAGYGAALHYFTGSKAHNIAVRKMGVDRGFKINEYGVYKGGKRIAGKTETEVYEQVGLPFIPPELRENNGEFKAAESNDLPELIDLSDIKGDLQSHTTASDGKFSLKDMAEAARKKGYEYLAVTDHSKRVSVAGGLDDKKLEQQLQRIEKLNPSFEDFRILKSIEVDILEDGSLDLSNDILKELDIVICSIHYNTQLTEKQQTKRVIKAMQNPHFHIFAHPTGRLIGEREPYKLDMDAVMDAAKDNNCFLELNAQPVRLDLSDTHCRMAKEKGIKLAISTDAHTTDDLDHMRFGIGQARRGWLEADDVLNTHSWNELKTLLKKS